MGKQVDNRSRWYLVLLLWCGIAFGQDAHTQQIHNVIDPDEAQDAATKNYVDSQNEIYGHFFIDEAAPVEVVISVQGTQEIVTSVTNTPATGEVLGMTFQNDQEFKIATAGKYLVVWGMSFSRASGGASREFEGGIGINGAFDEESGAHRVVGAGNDVGNMGNPSIADLAVDDTITLMVANEGGTENVVVEHGGIWLKLLDDQSATFTMDHGSLTGLSDIADHAYAFLHDGTRPMTGQIDMDDNEIVNVDFIDFDLVNGIPQAEGRMVWNDDEGTINIGLKGGVVNLQTGLEMVVFVKNVDGTTVANGEAVYFDDDLGADSIIEVKKPIATEILQAPLTLGIATEEILNGQFGYITVFGKVRDVDTSSWPANTVLYLSDSTAGELTSTRPTAPDTVVILGIVNRQSANEGVIAVKVIVQQRMSLASDVFVSSIANNDILQWVAGNSRWENTDSPTFAELDVDNININGNTISNTAPSGDLILATDFGSMVTLAADGDNVTVHADLMLDNNIEGQTIIALNGLRTDTPATTSGGGSDARLVEISTDLYEVQRDTSSRRYKENESDLIGTDKIYALRPKKFQQKGATDRSFYYGLMAEDVNEVAPEWCIMHDGKIDSVRYRDIYMAMLKEMIQMRTEINQLKQRVIALEN